MERSSQLQNGSSDTTNTAAAVNPLIRRLQLYALMSGEEKSYALHFCIPILALGRGETGC